MVDPGLAAPVLDLSDVAIELGEIDADEVLPTERIAVVNRGGGTLEWSVESNAGWVEAVAEDGAVVLHLRPQPGPNRANVYVRDTLTGAMKTVRVSVRVRPDPAPPSDEPTARESEPDRSRDGPRLPGLAVVARAARWATTTPTRLAAAGRRRARRLAGASRRLARQLPFVAVLALIVVGALVLGGVLLLDWMRTRGDGPDEPLATLSAPGTGVGNSVVFSPEGDLLVLAGETGGRMWDPVTHEDLGVLPDTDLLYSAAFSPDGSLIATAGDDGEVRLWDPGTREMIASLSGHNEPVYAVAFSPDGRLLASASKDYTVRLWDPLARTEVATLYGHGNAAVSVAFSPDGTSLVSASSSEVIFWNPLTHEQLGTLPDAERVSSVAFSPDGNHLATGSNDEGVELWDPTSRELIGSLSDEHDPVYAVAFSPDGKLLAAASDNHTIRLWDPDTEDHVGTLTGHESSVQSVAYSPDGDVLASTGYGLDGTINLWDSDTR